MPRILGVYPCVGGTVSEKSGVSGFLQRQMISHGWQGNTTDKVARQSHLEDLLVIRGTAVPSVGMLISGVERLQGKKIWRQKNRSSKNCTPLSQTTIFSPLILCLSLGCSRTAAVGD